MKTWIYRLAAAVLCAALLGAVPASFAENAPVRVGELTWLQEDSAQRSASLAEMQKKISDLSGTGSGGEEAPEGEDASGNTEASGEIDLYSCEKEIVYFDDLPSMLLALESGDIYAVFPEWQANCVEKKLQMVTKIFFIKILPPGARGSYQKTQRPVETV